jgi:hypothetical protein
MEVHASGRWNTNGLLAPGQGVLSIDVETPVGLVDTVCEAFGIAVCDSSSEGAETANYAATGPSVQRYTFDAATVIPIPIESLRLRPNPADGTKHQQVTGTVTIERPAPMDLTVVIYSSSRNAVVGAPSGQGSQREITIPKGGTSRTFKVLTDDNGLQPGEHVTSAITAFYAHPTTRQLRINATN